LSPDYFPLQPAKQRLLDGAEQLGLRLGELQAQSLCAYLALIWRWNKTYNLTAIATPDGMVDRHLLDSLSIAPYLAGHDIIDVGSGAGLPGVPLSLYYPDFRFCLLDKNGKRVRFLRHVKRSLGLANVEVVGSRSEHYQGSFDVVLARAVAGLEPLLEQAGHLCRVGGRFLAMKGHPEKLSAAHPAFEEIACHRLQVPGVDATRTLVVLAKHQA